ncbi:MAG: hypothetical protein OXG78_13285 [Chloroflexi bacterium]|nr:hypothetical protein [Chloroflexota bacterium]
MHKLRRALRHHLPFLIIMPLIIIVMTWPTIIRVFDREGFWLAQHNIDSNMLFWDAWYFERLITGRADYFFTDLLFYPEGVSLAFHNFSLPHMATMAALKTIFPSAKAFNLTFLLLTFLNAAAGYNYLNYLFRDRWVALFGAVVFGTSAFVMDRPAHSNIAFIATIPLSLYFLHRGLLEGSLRFMAIAGGLIGATAFIGMYTLVCLLIMFGFYFAYFAMVKWRERAFWLNGGLLLIVTAGFLLLRFYPMLADPQGLSGALSKNEGREIGKELLGYFINYHHPVIQPLLAALFPGLRPIELVNGGWHNVVFLGYVPLLLVALAFARSESRRRLLPWMILALPFLILRLGSSLTFNAAHYPDIILPKYYLTEALPHLFRPFWATDNFHAGTLFPFAALACCGLMALMRSIPGKRKGFFILVLTGLVAFDYYIEPSPFVLPKGRLDFIEWLGQQEDQESIRLINLPTGARNSKVYGFYQTYNGYPHAEGRPTRHPSSAFDYMESNLLLRNWRGNKTYNCLPGNQSDFIAAQAQLLDDGFTYILLHHDLINHWTVAPNFVNIPAAYSDEYVSIFRVEDLDESCNFTPTLWNQDDIRLFQTVEEKAIIPLHQFSLLSIFPGAYYDSVDERYYYAFLYSLRDSIPVHEEDIYGVSSGTADSQDSSPRAALTSNSVVLSVSNPGATDQYVIDNYSAWLARHFNSCGRFIDTETVVIEYFLRPGFPCELALDDAPIAVHYDNGIQLGNLLAAVNEDKLDLHLLWKRLPPSAHAFSVQLFDAAGNKAYNQDFVFHHDTLGDYEIDLSTLTPGTYDVKLIVYNYDTGVSLPGTVLSSRTRFDRELEVTRISIGAGRGRPFTFFAAVLE